MANEYWNSHYKSSVESYNDKITVHKSACNDWVNITHTCNGESVKITIKSRQITESLRFMLNQLLATEDKKE